MGHVGVLVCGNPGTALQVNEKFGIRLTDVVSQTERVNKLS